MNIKRRSTAVWNGSGKDGKGHLTTQSTVLERTQYSFNTRFAEGVGTNPEEPIAVTHAGCFTMKLSFVIGEAGFIPESISTDCSITLENGAITGSHLSLKATIPGIQPDKFNTCVEEAKLNCPISKLLNTSITLDATLV
jgi:osmotically inducible protein OsmC